MSCILRRRWKNEQSPAIRLSRFEQTPWIVGGSLERVLLLRFRMK